jgi:energy-coupling factor transporter ATP-binding protein EcfA2
MSHPFQATVTDIDALEFVIMQGTKIYNRQTFERKVLPRAERKMQRILEAVAAKDKPKSEDDDKYIIPQNLNVEQHLFNLTFCDEDRPIRFMNHAFRQYVPELGYWRLLQDEVLKQMILEMAEKACYPPNKYGEGRSLATAANVEKTRNYAITKLWRPSETTNKFLMAFKNCTVSVKTGATSPHSPSNQLTYCLPYDYEENAPCPEPMMRYILSSFGDTQIEYVRAALGLMLDLTAPKKFIHLIGPSGSGKGTFIRLLTKLFGQDTVAGLNDFHAFAKPESVHQNLAGMRLALIDDIVGYIGDEVARFCTAVECTTMAGRALYEKKNYNAEFDIRYAIASVTHLPTKHTNSAGWKRRVFPLQTVRLADQEEDVNLSVELENCIGGIVSWALSQDKEIRNQIIMHPTRYNPLAADYVRDAAASSSTAWAFMDECLLPIEPTANDTLEDQTISDQQLLAAYRAYCIAVGRQPSGLDTLKHQMREAFPLSWVDRQKGGKVKARFVYMRFRPGLFDFGEIGASCDVDKLGYDGVNLFKEWAKTYGCLHPYTIGELQRLNEPQPAPVEPTPTPEPTPVQATPQPTPQPEPVAPDHGCRDDAGNVVMAWITPGKDEWWQEFEHALIQATTLAQMQEAKAKLSAIRRTTVMSRWHADGRYPWLEAKEARLEAEANSFEQPTLGQSPPQPEIIELPDDWETSLPEYTP